MINDGQYQMSIDPNNQGLKTIDINNMIDQQHGDTLRNYKSNSASSK